jgi:hypothetical protein
MAAFTSGGSGIVCLKLIVGIGRAGCANLPRNAGGSVIALRVQLTFLSERAEQKTRPGG